MPITPEQAAVQKFKDEVSLLLINTNMRMDIEENEHLIKLYCLSCFFDQINQIKSQSLPLRWTLILKPLDPSNVNHPAHYGGDTPYEVIKVMEQWLTPEEFIGAMKFNFFKYNARARRKGEDLENYEKAQFYQNYLVDFIRRRNAKQSNRKQN